MASHPLGGFGGFLEKHAFTVFRCHVLFGKRIAPRQRVGVDEVQHGGPSSQRQRAAFHGGCAKVGFPGKDGNPHLPLFASTEIPAGFVTAIPREASHALERPHLEHIVAFAGLLEKLVDFLAPDVDILGECPRRANGKGQKQGDLQDGKSSGHGVSLQLPRSSGFMGVVCGRLDLHIGVHGHPSRGPLSVHGRQSSACLTLGHSSSMGPFLGTCAAPRPRSSSPSYRPGWRRPSITTSGAISAGRPACDRPGLWGRMRACAAPWPGADSWVGWCHPGIASSQPRSVAVQAPTTTLVI